jgi:hypothetical protein
MNPRITTAYFQGEILITNITGTDDAQVARAADLAYYTTIYEEEYLRKLLGDDLFDEYEAAIDALGTGEDPAQKWTDLIAQIYFTKNSKSMSPVADYVYFHYMRHNVTVTADGGQVTPNFENASYSGSSNKMVYVWNRMAKFTEDIREWIEDNIADYPLYDPDDPDPLRPINTIGL